MQTPDRSDLKISEANPTAAAAAVHDPLTEASALIRRLPGAEASRAGKKPAG